MVSLNLLVKKKKRATVRRGGTIRADVHAYADRHGPRVRAALQRVFLDWRPRIVRQVIAATDLGAPEKADLAVLLKARKSRDVEKILKQVDTQGFAVAVSDTLSDDQRDAFKEAGVEAVQVAGVEGDDADRMLDLVNEDAVQYAEERGAEMVGKVIDESGNLVDNPNPEWAIDETTREELRSLIQEALDDGLSADELARSIEEGYGFSDYRAEMIARTELTEASTQGTLAGWRESGVVESKRWLAAPDCCDECDDLDGEEVGLDEDFSSGDDGPPLHPNCRCTVLAVLSEEKGGEGEDEEDTEKADLVALLRKSTDSDAHQAATSPTNLLLHPTRAQARAGNYKKGHVHIGGLRISIENPEGAIRLPYRTSMAGHYGYVRGTVGADGGHVDCFVKPGTQPDYDGSVFVIDQVDPETRKFDEHKVMIGYRNAAEAKRAYLYSYQPGWKGFGAISEMSMEELRLWLRYGDTRSALALDKADLMRLLKGEGAGHPFRGNQYTVGESGSSEMRGTKQSGAAKETIAKLQSKAEAIAEQQGFPANRVSVVKDIKTTSSLLPEKFSVALGTHDSKTGKIQLNARYLVTNPAALKGILTHEISHDKLKSAGVEAKAYIVKNFDKLERDDGTSAYSKAMWGEHRVMMEIFPKGGAAATMTGRRAVDESLAEMARQGSFKGSYRGLQSIVEKKWKQK